MKKTLRNILILEGIWYVIATVLNIMIFFWIIGAVLAVFFYYGIPALRGQQTTNVGGIGIQWYWLIFGISLFLLMNFLAYAAGEGGDAGGAGLAFLMSLMFLGGGIFLSLLGRRMTPNVRLTGPRTWVVPQQQNVPPNAAAASQSQAYGVVHSNQQQSSASQKHSGYESEENEGRVPSIYCLDCGMELPSPARYCYRCGCRTPNP